MALPPVAGRRRAFGWLAASLAVASIGACASSPAPVDSTVTYEPVAHGRNAPSKKAPQSLRSPECAAFAPLVREVAAESGVDAGLLAGIATVESGWQPRAKSRAGARGLMQIMPSTGKRLDCGDLYEADENLRCGARLLKRLLARYDGAVDYALAAYALGAKATDRAFERRAEAPRQRFIQRVMAARKAWLESRCAS